MPSWLASHALEFYSASGNCCGATTFPIGGFSVGLDGTVIASSGEGACNHTRWTGLLH